MIFNVHGYTYYWGVIMKILFLKEYWLFVKISLIKLIEIICYYDIPGGTY